MDVRRVLVKVGIFYMTMKLLLGLSMIKMQPKVLATFRIREIPYLVISLWSQATYILQTFSFLRQPAYYSMTFLIQSSADP